MQKQKVSLGKRSYNICIGYDILSKIGEMVTLLTLGKSGAIITDTNVKEIWADSLQKGLQSPLPVYTIKPGESSKSIEVARDIYTSLLKWGLDRYSFLIALGGGVVGDLTGFVAATYMRGISYVGVPTTLMAQVDSSIGGKTAVDLPEGKNLVGCFWQPRLVFTDINTLNTLPKKELNVGLAEVIKYGVIKDRRLFESLENKCEDLFSIKKELWEPIITKCARIKSEVVSRDEKDVTGCRAILNYGHTIGHALEAVTEYESITHGEAVAFGMVAAAKISHKLGYLSKTDMDRQINLITKLGLVSQKWNIQTGDIVKRLRYDKKARQGKLRFVLARKIGKVIVTDKLTEDCVSAVLEELWQM